jgi:hypothetical protein
MLKWIVWSWGLYIFTCKHNETDNILLTTGVTSRVATGYPSGAPEFTPSFQWGSCYSIFSFICMFCRSLFVLLYLYLFVIVLSVLRYTDSDYPFGIFKLFLKIFLSVTLSKVMVNELNLLLVVNGAVLSSIWCITV